MLIVIIVKRIPVSNSETLKLVPMSFESPVSDRFSHLCWRLSAQHEHVRKKKITYKIYQQLCLYALVFVLMAYLSLNHLTEIRLKLEMLSSGSGRGD